MKYRNLTYCLVWNFFGKVEFPHSFWQFARNYAEAVPFN